MLRLLALCLLVTGCGPTYPNCNSDEDCNREKPRGEYCVNQKCQQCRGDKDCPSGKSCNKGRCDAIPGYCEDDRGCPPEQTCQDHRCKACVADDHCAEGEDCKQGICTPAYKRAPQDAACRLSAVYFDFNESALSTDAADALEKDAQCIKQVGRGVTLIGRTDNRGT